MIYGTREFQECASILKRDDISDGTQYHGPGMHLYLERATDETQTQLRRVSILVCH